MELVGIVLALILLAVVVALLYLAWRAPFIGLAVLVAGMAFHNFVIMSLLGLGTPIALVRIVQGWKEALIAVLAILALIRVLQMRREVRLPTLLPSDWLAIVFGAVISLYLVVPTLLHLNGPTLGQRLVAFRVAALLPIFYFLGRIHIDGKPTEHARAAWIMAAAGAAVGAFALVELWLIPTSTWLDWGVNRFSSLLGFTYDGPRGLPANFFHALPDGTLLRRAVSFYISPIGLAYTGLLVFPVAVALVAWPEQGRRSRMLAGLMLMLLIVGIEFSITRLALLALAGEGFLVALLLRGWTFGLFTGVSIAAALMLLAYPHVGPTVDRQTLQPVSTRSPDPATITSKQDPSPTSKQDPSPTSKQDPLPTITSSQDPSLAEHSFYLGAAIKFALTHPLGQGLGGSVNRFGASPSYGESAVFSMFGDIGWIGGLLHVLLYAAGLYNGARALFRSPPPSIRSCLPLVACVGGLALLPITITSDVWGDFSVTFLFWWAVGWSVSLVQGAVAPEEVDSPSAKTPDVAQVVG
jgi:hypothetical protein